MTWVRALVLCLLVLPLAAEAGTPLQPQPITEGIWLIPGSFPETREPDGNTIIFDAAEGLIVMDTGRHIWHRQAILDFATATGKPIAAIINSHWHLDHTSGNADLKRAYPQTRVWGTTAIDGAVRDFFPDSAKMGRDYLASGQALPELAEDVRNDLAVMDNVEALRPDIAVTESGSHRISGKKLHIHLAAHAATEGDVWVFDPQSGVVAAGDLITLPVPFLDTACVKGWQNELDAIGMVPFTTVIPGHGAPMSREQFGLYRTAFNSFTDCAKSVRETSDCATEWVQATAPLRAPEPDDDPRATGMAEYYAGMLRRNGGNSKFCKAP